MSNPDPFDILANESRRLIIGYLALYEPGDEIDVRTLAKQIGAIECGIPPPRITGNTYESVYNALIQNHLPKLSEAGVITYDDRGKTVSATASINDYQRLLVGANAVEITSTQDQ